MSYRIVTLDENQMAELNNRAEYTALKEKLNAHPLEELATSTLQAALTDAQVSALTNLLKEITLDDLVSGLSSDKVTEYIQRGGT